MSKKSRKAKVQHSEITGKFIVKVVLCIVIFNIVVRSDLWISISLFFFIGMYLLQIGIAKNIRQMVVNKATQLITIFHHEKINSESAGKKSGVNEPFYHTINEDSFDEIWRHYDHDDDSGE